VSEYAGPYRTLVVSCRLVLMGLLAALMGNPVAAQGIMVRPMRIEFDARPGGKYTSPVTVVSSIPDRETKCSTALVYLSQRLGKWLFTSGEDDGPPAGRSCLDWLKLRSRQVVVPALGHGEAELAISVPRQARGDYVAGLLVTTVPPATRAGQVSIAFQFAVPIILHVRGRLAVERVRIAEVGLLGVEGEHARVGQAKAGLTVANTGETCLSISARVRVLHQAGGRWREVERVEYTEKTVLPGVTTLFEEPLKRRLPSGLYRVAAELWTSGRRRDSMERDVTFQGDPSVEAIRGEVELMPDPPSLEVESVPGARRTAVLNLANPSTETVHVKWTAATPEALEGVAMGPVFGDDFSGREWVSVSPDEFELPTGRQRRVRVSVQAPTEGCSLPNYYVDLIGMAVDEEGEEVGTCCVPLFVRNTACEEHPAAKCISLRIAQEGPEQYAVLAKFGNVGDVHFVPGATLELRTSLGSLVHEQDMATASGIVLPLGTPEFSASLSLRDIEPGAYVVHAKLEYLGHTVEGEQPLVVSLEDGVKSVNLTKPEGRANVEEDTGPVESADGKE